jgi:glycosyltransferase involved in cell wall biosynthesis
MGAIKAIVTTMDNLPNLKEQIPILRDDSLVDEIVVVNQESRDGTGEWLDRQGDLTVIHRQNNGAGPGRNAGLDAAGDADFYLMIDGGIRPLRGGTQRMLDYLDRHPEVDVIAPHWHDLETDYEKAWRRWHKEITDDQTFKQGTLSNTHYCLGRFRALGEFRFSEEGPFAEPGWGADDDELMHRWTDAGIVVHVVAGMKVYRRASGSFRRLFQETGIWPNQYGSTYEKRCVWLQHNQPQHGKVMQWGEPWMTVVIKVGELEETIRLIKRAHDLLYARRYEKKWGTYPNPYSVIAWGDSPGWHDWAQWRYLRQQHGDATIIDGKIVRRTPKNEELWTGDFRMWDGDDWREAVRPNAFYYGLACNMDELEALIAKYNETHKGRTSSPKDIPKERKEL